MTLALQRLAVHDVMHRYAFAIDTRRWNLMTDVFAPEISADFRSFGAKSVWSGTRDAWVAQIRSAIDGMDATQHLMGNHLYAIDQDRAVGTTYIQARHVCANDRGGDTYTVGGHYEVEMVQREDHWLIEHYALICTWHEGNRHVLKAAARRIAV